MVEKNPTDQEPMTAPAAAAGGPAEHALASALRTVFGVLRVVMVIVLVALLFSNTRFLRQDQRAVILRFGKIVGTGARRVRGPGLVFAWPQPVDKIITVDAGRIQNIEVDDFMYRKGAREGGGESLGETLVPGFDGYTLTGNANIIHTIWGVQYQVSDVVNYALHVEDPEELVRKALAAAVVHASAELSVDQALWVGGEQMRAEVRGRLQQRLDEAESGIEIVRVTTPMRVPPKQTEEAFVRATKASLDASKEKQQAERYRESRLGAVAGDAGEALAEKLVALAEAEEAAEPDEAAIAALRGEVAVLLDGAGGEVAQILSDAKAYRNNVRETARSMAETFEALNLKYEENPEVFVRETYEKAMEQVLSQAGAKFILYPRDREWRILLERKKKKPEKEKAPVGGPTEEELRRRGEP